MVICAHPFLLCALLRSFIFELPLLIYLTPTPLTLVPFRDRAWVLGQLSVLINHRYTAIFAASQIYSLHAFYQTGFLIQSVRPSSLYIAETYQWGSGRSFSKNIYVWSGMSEITELAATAQILLSYGQSLGLPELQGLTFFL